MTDFLLEIKSATERTTPVKIYLAVLVAVGSSTSTKSEKFEEGAWSVIQEPPGSGKFSEYAAIFHGFSHYYFGRFISDEYSIHQLQEKSWSWKYVGEMKSKYRSGHRVIKIGEKFMVLGGLNPMRNEACLLQSGWFSCTEFGSELTSYHFPILHPVDENYKNC